MRDGYRLLIPGPIEVSDEVLRWMGGPVQPHYGPKWVEVHREMVALLQAVLQTKGDIFMMPGVGSAGLDAALGSLLPPGGKAIVGINGFFGERLATIVEMLGGLAIRVEAEWGKPLDPAAFALALRAHPEAAAVALVHLETSTGVQNPAADIAQVAHARSGAPVMVDAVSSAGGMELPVDEWGIDVCVTASQKCLGAPPGLAIVTVGPRAWEAIEQRPNRNHGWYLNLEVWRQFAEEWADWHPFPVTMATSLVLALRAGVQELLRDGVKNRVARYQRLADHLRAGLAEMGMKQVPAPECASPVITATFGPPGVDTAEIVAHLDQQHHIKIAGGMGRLKGKIIRVGHMGSMVTMEDLDQVILAIRDFLQ